MKLLLVFDRHRILNLMLSMIYAADWSCITAQIWYDPISVSPLECTHVLNCLFQYLTMSWQLYRDNWSHQNRRVSFYLVYRHLDRFYVILVHDTFFIMIDFFQVCGLLLQASTFSIIMTNQWASIVKIRLIVYGTKSCWYTYVPTKPAILERQDFNQLIGLSAL